MELPTGEVVYSVDKREHAVVIPAAGPDSEYALHLSHTLHAGVTAPIKWPSLPGAATVLRSLLHSRSGGSLSILGAGPHHQSAGKRTCVMPFRSYDRCLHPCVSVFLCFSPLSLHTSTPPSHASLPLVGNNATIDRRLIQRKCRLKCPIVSM